MGESPVWTRFSRLAKIGSGHHQWSLEQPPERPRAGLRFGNSAARNANAKQSPQGCARIGRRWSDKHGC
jgi:hypothetical protein